MHVVQLAGDESDAERILALMYDLQSPWRVAAQLFARPLVAGRRSRVRPHSALALSDRGWRGTTAGGILVRLALMDQLGKSDPSVRKAVWSLRKHASLLGLGPDGKPSQQREDIAIPRTERSMWKAWKDFRATSHLWAAHRIAERHVAFYEMPDALRDDRFRAAFLGHAQWYLEFAFKYQSRNSHEEPILDCEGALKFEPMPTASTPDATWLSDELTRELEGYAAPPSIRRHRNKD